MQIYDTRLLAQCRYEVSLASRLRRSTRAERAGLYAEVYDLYNQHFPEALSDKPNKKRSTAFEAFFVRNFVDKESVVAELGPGRCDLSLMLAPAVKAIFAIDVADYLGDTPTPDNFHFKLCDGIHYPLPDNAVDVVISNELIEHLHPEDAALQIVEVLRILKPGGVLLCGTPNQIGGPHDCSNIAPDLPCEIVDGMYVANGLHLQEYTNATISQLLFDVGFTDVKPFCGMRGTYFAVPRPAMIAVETLLRQLPLPWRSRSPLLRALIGVRLAARK